MTGANLVFVAGASPQIITETVSALAQQGAPPSRVFVLTTETGRAVIVRELFGRPGHWKRLIKEYPALRHCDFSRHDITVLRDDRGKPLFDVRSPADSTAAGDQIVEFVAEHTGKGRPPLHASLAGGRKTMGYLLAAAMMMYGRREDRLSHVLVHPPELEGTDFFFLPRRPAGVLTYRKPDRRTVRVSAAELRVELADLPFLRLRALHDPAELRRTSFSNLVNELQADLDALAAPRLTIMPDAGSLLCAGREVRLSPVKLAMYELLALRRRAGCGQKRCGGCPSCFVSAAEICGSFRSELRALLQSRGSPAVGTGQRKWSEGDFRSERSKINKRLRAVLRHASEPFEIHMVGERNARRYGLRLDPAAISRASRAVCPFRRWKPGACRPRRRRHGLSRRPMQLRSCRSCRTEPFR